MFSCSCSNISKKFSRFLFLLTLIKIFRSTNGNFPSKDNEINRRAEEYVMTSASIDGIKRSNVCGDGYWIEGALLKSYPHSKQESYWPYEDCSMTFKARRADQQIRIRILFMDLNDIQAGVNCLDALRFYKSPFIQNKEKIEIPDCGKWLESDGIFQDSPTGIVTAHFSSDGGNVSGRGFKIVLTSFRFPNKTNQCETNDDEFSCKSQECISSSLLCDNVPHCLDGSDESPNFPCSSEDFQQFSREKNSRTTFRRHHWRGIVIAAFLLIIFSVFVVLTFYVFLRRCFAARPVTMINGERKNYATIVNSSTNGPRSSGTPTTTQVLLPKGQTKKRLDEDYNLL